MTKNENKYTKFDHLLEECHCSESFDPEEAHYHCLSVIVF